MREEIYCKFLKVGWEFFYIKLPELISGFYKTKQ